MTENRYGAQIYTLEQLDEAAKRGWEVILKPHRGKDFPCNWHWDSPVLAKFVMLFSGCLLLELFSYGLFRYLEKP